MTVDRAIIYLNRHQTGTEISRKYDVLRESIMLPPGNPGHFRRNLVTHFQLRNLIRPASGTRWCPPTQSTFSLGRVIPANQFCFELTNRGFRPKCARISRRPQWTPRSIIPLVLPNHGKRLFIQKLNSTRQRIITAGPKKREPESRMERKARA